MTRYLVLSAALLSVAAGCNCSQQSWRRGPACQQAPMAAPACDPCAGASAGMITPYMEDMSAPTLRGTPVPGPQ